MTVQQRAETLMTIPQAASFLSRDPSTIRNAVDRGTIPHARIGTSNRRGGIIVVDQGDIRAYAERNGIDMR